MESTRRWSGYVCPDCRFVFRVPRDHDGQGIVCPSCRRMLRIPTASDTPPPLLAPLRTTASREEAPPEEPSQVRVKKRRRGKKGEDDHSWEKQSRSHRSSSEEKSQVNLMLAGGGLLILLISGGAAFSLMRKNTTTTQAPTANLAPVAETSPSEVETKDVARGEAELLAEAEPLAKKFLEAKTIEEMLPLVRHPETTGPRMKEFYPDGKIPSPGLAQFNSRKAFSQRGKIITAQASTGNFENLLMAFEDGPDGLKVDWESHVGWSAMTWDRFVEEKPTEAQVFRVDMGPVSYYNFEFSDESKWMSYRLLSPDGEHSIYGYVERGSMLQSQIRLDGGVKTLKVMLALRFLPGSNSNNQVVIDRFVSDVWVEEDAK